MIHLKRKFARVFSFVLGVSDILAVNLAVSAAWYLRFRLELFFPLMKDFQPWRVYVEVGLLMSAIWVVVFGWAGLYRATVRVRSMEEVMNLIRGTAAAVVISMALSFAYRGATYSRLTFLFMIPLAIVILWFMRRLVRSAAEVVLRTGRGVARVLLLGVTESGLAIWRDFESDPVKRRAFAGFLNYEDDSETAPEGTLRGPVAELGDILLREPAQQVILTRADRPEAEILRLIQICTAEDRAFSMVPLRHELFRGNLEVLGIGNIPVVAYATAGLKPWQRLAKKSMDLLAGAAIVTVFSPLLLFIAAAIKIDTPGPVFIRQERVGRSGRRFRMFKFRSMVVDAEKKLRELQAQNEAEGKIFKIKVDPRITRVGKWLRRFSMDELPQIFNVLLGDMSLVGPRPPLPREVEDYEDWETRRIETVPGMTGLWQVSGRSDLPFAEMVRLDVYYIENWSIWLDVKILLLTIPAVLSGKGAY